MLTLSCSGTEISELLPVRFSTVFVGNASLMFGILNRIQRAQEAMAQGQEG
jgi:hypothetical protein